MELFTPFYKSKEAVKRIKWIQKKFNHLNDIHIKILNDIAFTDHDYVVRMTAVENMTNKTLLEKIAAEDKNLDVRQTAFKKLGKANSNEALFDLILHSSDITDCSEAVEKLSDQHLMAEIVKNSNRSSIKQSVINKISSQSLLADIVINGKYGYENAIQKINDQRLLSEIVLKKKDKFLIQQALEKINDQNLLSEIAEKTDSMYVLQRLVDLMKDLGRKTDCLIRLFHFDYKKHIQDEYARQRYKPEIAEKLKKLYENENLPQEYKLKILEMNGKSLETHYDEGCNGHTDSGGRFQI